MKMRSHLSIAFLCSTLFNCTSPIVDSFRRVQYSIEQSEKAYKTSNKELLSKIHDVGIDSCSNQADSIYFAAEDVHRVVNNYKERIANLDSSGSNTDVAYEVVASQDIISGALISATSKLVYRTSSIAVEDSEQKRMDSLANNIKSIQYIPINL